MTYLDAYEAATAPARLTLAKAARIARWKPLADAYAAGEPSHSVAARFDTDFSTVLKAARFFGVPIRKQGGHHQRKVPNHAAVVAMHDGGKRSMQEVGDHFGITRERVRQILVRAGVDRRTYEVKEQQRDEAVRRAEAMFAEGGSLREVSGALGVSPHSLRVWCKAAGVATPRRADGWKAERERYAQMAALYDAGGITIFEVAQRFGVSTGCVARAMAIHGVSDNRPHIRAKRPALTDQRAGG